MRSCWSRLVHAGLCGGAAPHEPLILLTAICAAEPLSTVFQCSSREGAVTRMTTALPSRACSRPSGWSTAQRVRGGARLTQLRKHPLRDQPGHSPGTAPADGHLAAREHPMSTGIPRAAHDRLDQLSGAAPCVARPYRQNQLLLVDPETDAPLDALQAQEQVGELGRQVRID